jgi:glycosyltransferase involved in cell wall biosynthesis
MKLAVLTCGMLPIPAVQGGAVENLIDFYLEYNNIHHLHDITIYSPWDDKVVGHPALASEVNHYHYIDVSSLKARLERKLFKLFRYSSKDYFNYFIEYYFEKAYADIKNRHYDYIILENSDGHAYKLSQRGYRNIIIHMNNEARKSRIPYHRAFQNNLSLILTCSDFIKESISGFMPDCKIQTLYNAIDTKNFFPKEKPNLKREEIGLNSNDFVIVYSGRINKEKGISELIDAMLQLKDYPNIKLMIIGGTFYGNAKNEDEFVRSLKHKAKDIEDKIVFTGFIPYKNVPNYLHLADIAALPSMWDEPFGLTIAEALATGLPLITTRSGGIPEICEGVATILDREHIVDNLANAILDLYHHPEKRKLMAKASMERAQQFDKETYAKNFFDALENL